jgi:hypothetical protein
MLLVLVKIYCNQPISADNSNMFGTRYLSYMVNIICQTVVKEAEVKFKYGIYTEEKMVDRQLIIEPQPRVSIRVRFEK